MAANSNTSRKKDKSTRRKKRMSLDNVSSRKRSDDFNTDSAKKVRKV